MFAAWVIDRDQRALADFWVDVGRVWRWRGCVVKVQCGGERRECGMEGCGKWRAVHEMSVVTWHVVRWKL